MWRREIPYSLFSLDGMAGALDAEGGGRQNQSCAEVEAGEHADHVAEDVKERGLRQESVMLQVIIVYNSNDVTSQHNVRYTLLRIWLFKTR